MCLSYITFEQSIFWRHQIKTKVEYYQISENVQAFAEKNVELVIFFFFNF